MLMRNIEPPRLCNGTRMIVTGLQPNVIEADIITGRFHGETAFIHRISNRNKSAQTISFTRRQFPCELDFAMTINKAQGQSLGKILGYLRSPCFAHGDRQNIKICTGNKYNTTKIVVYREVLPCRPAV